MKTLPQSKFKGRLTLGAIEKIAPEAISRLDISSAATRNAFSHGLGHKQTVATVCFRVFGGRCNASRAAVPLSRRAPKPALLDDSVSACEQRSGQRDAQLASDLKVDDQVELQRAFDWQVAGSGTL